METMQISLVQALAPEPSAPESERTDEFSSILSGKEAENKAESPPGQPPPPVQKPAVEEAGKQEPNAQSQKPDFHCNDETKSDGESLKEAVEVPEGTKPTEGDPQQVATTTVSTPQLAAQTALAWIGLLPEQTVPVDVQLDSGTVTTVKIDPANIELTGDPATIKLAADAPSSIPQPATPEATLFEMPAQVAETVNPAVLQETKVANHAPNAVPINDLYALIEDKPENVDIRVQQAPVAPTETKTQPATVPIQNPQVEQVATSVQPIEVETPVKVVSTPDEQVVHAVAVESPEPRRSEQMVTPESPKDILNEKKDQPAGVKVETPTIEVENNSQKVGPEEKQVMAEIALKAQPVEATKPVAKASIEEKPIEKSEPVGKPEPLHKTANAKNEQTAFSGSQNQPSQDQTTESKPEEIKVEPVQTSNVQQTPQELKLTVGKPAASESLQPIDSKKTEEVVRQIVDRVETIAATHRPGGVVIRLNPEDLGTITMAVKSIGDQVEAHIVASDDRVRTALDTSRSQLAQAIEAKGFSLKSVTVNEATSTQTQSDLTNQDRSQSQQQARQDQKSLRQQANMWTYAYTNADAAMQRSGFARTASGGLDLWT